jgi:hypothetical protein
MAQLKGKKMELSEENADLLNELVKIWNAARAEARRLPEYQGGVEDTNPNDLLGSLLMWEFERCVNARHKLAGLIP